MAANASKKRLLASVLHHASFALRQKNHCGRLDDQFHRLGAGKCCYSGSDPLGSERAQRFGSGERETVWVKGTVLSASAKNKRR